MLTSYTTNKRTADAVRETVVFIFGAGVVRNCTVDEHRGHRGSRTKLKSENANFKFISCVLPSAYCLLVFLCVLCGSISSRQKEKRARTPASLTAHFLNLISLPLPSRRQA